MNKRMELWHGLIPITPEGWPEDEPLLLLKDVDGLWKKRERERWALDAERLARAYHKAAHWGEPDVCPTYDSFDRRLGKDMAAEYVTDGGIMDAPGTSR